MTSVISRLSPPTTRLRAYKEDEKLKAKIMARIAAHRRAHEIGQGIYYQWECGKLQVCAVGCVLHNPAGGHVEYEREFGIPVELAYLEEVLFESMNRRSAIRWPERFMGAIEPGVDLSAVWPRFAVWMLTTPRFGMVSDACRLVAEAYECIAAGKAVSRAHRTELIKLPLYESGPRLAWAARRERHTPAAAHFAWRVRCENSGPHISANKLIKLLEMA